MQIKVDDLSGKEIAKFLEEHITEMKAVSPPESKHALDIGSLRKPEITFWIAIENNQILGCGAIKELDKYHGEIKSMRTSSTYRKRGVASAMLEHIIKESKKRKYRKLSLETGAMDFFYGARTLYSKFGFKVCSPFSNYKEDPNSVFMTLEI